MTTQQNSTQMQAVPEAEAKGVGKEKRLSWSQDQYITFCATSGISMTEDGEFQVMNAKQFAAAIGYDRTTLYYWQQSIPNFWQLVDQRARVVFNKSTKFAIIKGLKLKAMAGDVKAAEMLWSHFGDYTPPAQKHEVKLNGWGDVVREVRKQKIKASRPAELIEAEVVATTSPPPPVPQPVIAPEGSRLATPDVR